YPATASSACPGEAGGTSVAIPPNRYRPFSVATVHFGWWVASIGLCGAARTPATAHNTIATRQGKLSRAASVLERVVNLCQDDRPAWFPLLAAALGATYTAAGHIDDARVLLRQGLDLAVATEIVVNQAVCSVGLADAELQAGHLDESDCLAGRALSLARAHGERGSEAYALHVLGEIFVRRVPIQQTQAEDRYLQALDVAETLGMRPLQAHCR